MRHLIPLLFFVTMAVNAQPVIHFDEVDLGLQSPLQMRDMLLNRNGDTFFISSNDTVGIYRAKTEEIDWVSMQGTAGYTSSCIDSGGMLHLALDGRGVAVTNDGGAKWFLLTKGLSNLRLQSLVTAPDGTVYLGTYNGLYKLIHPLIWEEIPTGIETPDFQDLHILPNGDLFALVHFSGYMSSSDGGHSWELDIPTFDAFERAPRSSQFSVSKDGTVYLATQTEMYTSVDGGDTFSPDPRYTTLFHGNQEFNSAMDFTRGNRMLTRYANGEQDSALSFSFGYVEESGGNLQITPAVSQGSDSSVVYESSLQLLRTSDSTLLMLSDRKLWKLRETFSQSTVIDSTLLPAPVSAYIPEVTSFGFFLINDEEKLVVYRSGQLVEAGICILNTNDMSYQYSDMKTFRPYYSFVQNGRNEFMVRFWGYGFYLSKDGGYNWELANDSLERFDDRGQLVGGTDEYFYFETKSTTYRYSSTTGFWVEVNKPAPESELYRHGSALSLHALPGGAILSIGWRGDVVYRSSDNGNSWYTISPFFDFPYTYRGLTLAWRNTAKVFAAARATPTLMHSDDKGATWSPANRYNNLPWRLNFDNSTLSFDRMRVAPSGELVTWRDFIVSCVEYPDTVEVVYFHRWDTVTSEYKPISHDGIWDVNFLSNGTMIYSVMYGDDSGLYILKNPVVHIEEPVAANDHTLGQAYPNPVSSADVKITIPFELNSPSEVTMTIYNMLGKTVKEVRLGVLAMGSHTHKFSTASIPAGMYYYTLQTETGIQTKPLVVQ